MPNPTQLFSFLSTPAKKSIKSLIGAILTTSIEMIKNITDGGKLILLIEEDKIKLSNGYFAFRLE